MSSQKGVQTLFTTLPLYSYIVYQALINFGDFAVQLVHTGRNVGIIRSTHLYLIHTQHNYSVTSVTIASSTPQISTSEGKSCLHHSDVPGKTSSHSSPMWSDIQKNYL